MTLRTPGLALRLPGDLSGWNPGATGHLATSARAPRDWLDRDRAFVHLDPRLSLTVGETAGPRERGFPPRRRAAVREVGGVGSDSKIAAHWKELLKSPLTDPTLEQQRVRTRLKERLDGYPRAVALGRDQVRTERLDAGRGRLAASARSRRLRSRWGVHTSSDMTVIAIDLPAALHPVRTPQISRSRRTSSAKHCRIICYVEIQRSVGATLQEIRRLDPDVFPCPFFILGVRLWPSSSGDGFGSLVGF